MFPDNDCGLTETIIVTGLPESGFVEHRAEEKDFVLSASDKIEDAGLYTVTIAGSLEAPDQTYED